MKGQGPVIVFPGTGELIPTAVEVVPVAIRTSRPHDLGHGVSQSVIEFFTLSQRLDRLPFCQVQLKPGDRILHRFKEKRGLQILL